MRDTCTHVTGRVISSFGRRAKSFVVSSIKSSTSHYLTLPYLTFTLHAVKSISRDQPESIDD